MPFASGAAVVVALSSMSSLHGCYMRARGCDVGIEYYGQPPVMNAGIDLPLEPAGEVHEMVPAQAQRLAEVFAAAAQRSGADRATVAVIAEDGALWTANSTGAGLSDGDGATLDDDATFWWASVGKAFTAMVVMQLAEEGALSLDSPVSMWLPGLDNADFMTVRDLLQHTSGLFSFNAIESVRARADHVPPDALLAAAQTEGALFCPGQSWSYSNTGYTVLGLIIEQVTEQSYEDALRQRVLEPLPEPQLDVVAESIGALQSGNAPPRSESGGLDADLRTPWAAGAITGSASAMVRAWRAFMQGDVVGGGQLRRMFAEAYPMFGNYVETYGLGVMVYDLYEADPTQTDRWFGHSGGGLGYQTVVAWSEETGATIAVALENPERGSAEAVALAVLGALR